MSSDDELIYVTDKTIIIRSADPADNTPEALGLTPIRWRPGETVDEAIARAACSGD